MLIIPAIDLKNGQCVRLYQGDFNQVTVYDENPVNMALRWEREGAQFLHLVDLDGAVQGEFVNRQAVKSIIEAVNIPVQLGGGIRNIVRIKELLDLGINRVILGTAALKDPDLVKEAVNQFGEQIVLGLDAKNGKVAINGWLEEGEDDYIAFALKMRELGIGRVIYTDIALDGTLKGPNLMNTKKLAIETGLKVVASGGVSSYEDIENLMALESYGVEASIVGKAFYTENISLPKVLAMTREEPSKC
jgi:phosphoribosylformimino-5-aminoimidazole carboxamide ribotide isomerase